MSAQMRGTEPSRELRLEGLGLTVAGLVLVAALVGAFFVGRWSVESPASAEAGETQASDPLANVMEPVGQATEVDQGLNYFDTLEGQEKQAEPAREMPQASPPQAASRPVASAVPPAGGRGPAPVRNGRFWVQVWAGRDQSAAAGLVRRLEGEGRGVKLSTMREGSGALYKVRVGGYGTREAARSVADELKSQGYQGAWVTEETTSG